MAKRTAQASKPKASPARKGHNKPPKAYSYIRMSRPEQLRGDSLRRQLEAAKSWAAERGLELDDSLRDIGVSAYRGKNRDEGALRGFLDLVEKGDVERGSFLIVESLDRLSREAVLDALPRFLDLVNAGVVIVTLQDRQEYSADKLRSDWTPLILSLAVMARAHEESATKADRLSKAWANKKARAAAGQHILTNMAPLWLEVVNGKFRVIPERGRVVKRIFAMAGKGHGKVAIARQLNVDGVPTFGGSSHWYPSYIQKILRSEAVIGRFQPHKITHDEFGRRQRVPEGDPIEGYFPAVVSEADYYRVKHSKPGPSGKGAALPKNELSGLVFCARCGGVMHFVNKGKPPKGGTYLACDTARRKKKCDAPSVRYEPVVTHVLDNLTEYRSLYNATLPSPVDVPGELEKVAGEIAETEATIERLLDTLERVASATAEKRLATAESHLAALKARKKELFEKSQIGQDEAESFDTLLANAEWVDIDSDDSASGLNFGAMVYGCGNGSTRMILSA